MTDLPRIDLSASPQENGKLKSPFQSVLAERSAATAAEALTKSSTSEPFLFTSLFPTMMSGRSFGAASRFSSEMELAKLSMLHKTRKEEYQFLNHPGFG